jgi:hypothetical protein
MSSWGPSYRWYYCWLHLELVTYGKILKLRSVEFGDAFNRHDVILSFVRYHVLRLRLMRKGNRIGKRSRSIYLRSFWSLLVVQYISLYLLLWFLHRLRKFSKSYRIDMTLMLGRANCTHPPLIYVDDVFEVLLHYFLLAFSQFPLQFHVPVLMHFVKLCCKIDTVAIRYNLTKIDQTSNDKRRFRRFLRSDLSYHCFFHSICTKDLIESYLKLIYICLKS